MDQVLHGSARTTPAVRRALQASTDSLANLAAQESIPHLARSALHRLFQRHGISQLPEAAAPDQTAKKKFKAYPIGYFHVDFIDLRLANGKLYLFVAIDRTSKLAFAELHPAATAELAAAFWRRVVQAVPYTISKVLTDNGVRFSQLPHRRSPVAHLFDAVCTAHGIEHRCAQVAHPWTNGQVEQLNHTLKEAAIQQYYYQGAIEPNAHLQTFLQAYNGGKRLKKLHGQTPYAFVGAQFAQNPGIFIRNADHNFPGLYIQ